MLISFLKNHHTKNTVYLAWPIVITQIGHILTGMVDTFFLGKIGPTEQAACILSTNLYILFLVFLIGVSYATTPLVTNAHENNNLIKKASLFKNSIFLNLMVSILCFFILFSISDLLNYMKQPKEVVALAIPFFNVLIFSIIPISLFFTCKQYCEGLSNTRIALIISVFGNLINIFLNYVLIYGKCGFCELGYMGSAWASFIARLFMGISFLFLIFWLPFTKEINAVFSQVKINLKDLIDLIRIGINTGFQFTIELAAFVVAGLMAGYFGKEQIDSHGIALSFASFTYMFASGISSAVTIRIAIFKAQNNWFEIKNAAIVSVKLILLVMSIFGLILLIFNSILPLAFSNDSKIIQLASKLLIVAAIFQLFDGLQVTFFGILRGLEDVKIPTAISLTGYWLVALPLSYFFAFYFKLETLGVWYGLLIALIFASVFLCFRLIFLINKFNK